jgi:hypothetical protein
VERIIPYHIVPLMNNLSRPMAEKLMEALEVSWWSRHGTIFRLHDINGVMQITASRNGVYSDTELADLGGFCSGFYAGVMSVKT